MRDARLGGGVGRRSERHARGGSSDRTLRIILTPHVASIALRIHLSNRFGSQPVTFDRVSVARRQAGAALTPGTSVPVTFGGAASVTVPVGGEVQSDPAALTFAAFQDLAVSLYLKDQPGPATGHLLARERSYSTARSAGDHTSDEAAGAFGSSTTTAAYVDAVDAAVPAGVGTVVAFGDSITDGYESNGGGSGEEVGGIDLNHRFPDYLARRLLAQPGGPRLSVVDAGISGNRLLVDGHAGSAGPSGLSRLGSDVLGVAGVTDAIVLEGINDIALMSSAGQVEAGLAQVVDRLHQVGVRVLIGTLSPAGTGLLSLGSLLPSIFIPDSANGVRVMVNAWIRSGASHADGVIDFDAALRGPVQSSELNPGLDSGDHVHPSYLGYQKMADMVDLASLRGAQCAAGAPRAAARLRLRARAESGGRLRVTGSLVTPRAGDCAGAAVVVRAVRSGHTILRRRVAVRATCTFATTKTKTGRGRIQVRVSFAGTPTLLAAKARSVYVRVP